jgi:hypothetical protein
LNNNIRDNRYLPIYYYGIEAIFGEFNPTGKYPVSVPHPTIPGEFIRRAGDGLSYDVSLDGRVSIVQNVRPDDNSDIYNTKFTLTANESITVSLIVATYDESGHLLSFKIETKSLDPGIATPVETTFEKTSGANYKAFIWDSNFVPLMNVNADSE